MTYIKKSHQAVLRDAGEIIERRKDTLNEAETSQYEAYKNMLTEMESENEIVTEKASSYNKLYSKTERGRETNRERQRRFRERHKKLKQEGK